MGIGFGVVDDLIEEGVGVELEDGGVGVFAGEVGREGGEAGVPVGEGAGRDGVAPFAGEGQAVERGDVEEEEVAGAGGVELFVEKRSADLISEVRNREWRWRWRPRSPARARMHRWQTDSHRSLRNHPW